MTNKIDDAAGKMSGFFAKTPLVSVFTAAAVPASLLVLAVTPFPLFITAAVSPFACALATANGGMNLLRGHGNLSKAFSAAAATAGVVGVGGVLAYMNAPELEPLSGYIISALAMTAAGVLNTAAHYTRKVQLKLTTTTKGDDTPPAPPAP
jgi:hypothetical protein